MNKDEEAKQQQILTVAHRDNQRGMNALAYFKVHNHEISEDMVQTAFLKSWNYIVKGGKIEIMKAFLYHILNNLIVDEYRKHKTTSLDVLIEKGFEPGTDNTNNIINNLDGKMASFLIDKLPEKYKKVIKMKYMQNLSLKEISLISGQTKNAIAVQLHRGLEKLKLLYKHV